VGEQWTKRYSRYAIEVGSFHPAQHCPLLLLGAGSK
jgi:hypothetical protein